MLKLALLSALLLLSAVPVEQNKNKKTETYAVIVNMKNKCSQKGAAAKATVKKLFLKQMAKWPDGITAKPYGRKAGGSEQDAFVKGLLGMGNAELARHWLKMKNMNGTTPPKGVSSDRMILKYVEKHDGAFGIVKMSETKKSKGIKVLCSF
ncbi:MAG: hypothetical protein ACI89X_001233 [Planctomycetota bacterium]|jgi:hypothetical protein